VKASLVIASEAKQSISRLGDLWIASLRLSSGAHWRDPLARNDGGRHLLIWNLKIESSGNSL